MGWYVHKLLKTARITSVPERLAPPSQCGGTEVMPSSVAPLPALPSSQGRVPREPPTLILPSAFDASIFDATAVYETTHDAHTHGSRQLYEPEPEP